MRWLLAKDAALCTKVIAVFLRALEAFQRKRAKALGVSSTKAGFGTFLQRFSTALQLNVHLHTVTPGGVFSVDNDDAPATFEDERDDVANAAIFALANVAVEVLPAPHSSRSRPAHLRSGRTCHRPNDVFRPLGATAPLALTSTTCETTETGATCTYEFASASDFFFRRFLDAALRRT